MKNPGQLFITGISGTTLTLDEKKFLKDEMIGGVILFSKNFESPQQLCELTREIQSLKKEDPFFISVDHEGGRIIRFKKFFTQFPSMLSIGNLSCPETYFQVAKIMGEELSSCGINLNFSPVCDIFTNPKNEVIGDRSFGRDHITINKLIPSFIKGLKESHVLTCAKHFPGHGDSFEDSHFDLPVLKTPLKTLKERELLPFKCAIDSGVDFVMMGHLLVDAIDPDFPASLSPKAHELLIKGLNFNGLIISDDFQMEAITKKYTAGLALILSLKAGTDVVEYRDMAYTRKCLEELKRSIANREISTDLISMKLAKISNFKKQRLKLTRDLRGNLASDFAKKFASDLKQKLAD
ncbi:MAG: beta-N-acetylhexosaminidase [Epsilonproteobacteria bacterium]|nr:MAG: beta-N-acetylhexosaminidase [Campylobacterota bacterium]RLA66102.1 MAG: beta-N-acetylhexosaminidase [Campylobacterota bacterium]